MGTVTEEQCRRNDVQTWKCPLDMRRCCRGVSELLQRGRQNAAKSVNAVLTTTYWLVGRRLVEFEQRGKERAVYGSELLKRLSGDLQSTDANDSQKSVESL